MCPRSMPCFGSRHLFKGKLWLQVFGTAIRTSLAPDYCGIFLGDLEREAFERWKVEHPEVENQLQFYKRIIDNGFCLWPKRT